MILEKVYDELMAQIEDLKKAVATMSGGSGDYDDLSNRPKVNNITLTGNKKSSDLKIVYSMTEAEYAAATKNAESIYCLQENANTFEEEDETASTYIHWSEASSGYVASWVYTPSNQNFTGCTGVDCDDPAITIDNFSVVEGNVQVFLSCEDTTQIGETVTFTFTLTQAAGSTRIMKNGLQFGGYRESVLYTGTALANTMALSENIKSFDMVSFIGEYKVQEKTFHQIVTVPKSVIAAVSSDGSEIQITNDAYYIAITIDSDGMGLTKGTYQSTIYISKVIGIKF